MTVPVNTAATHAPRPKDVGILAMDTYFPLRVGRLLSLERALC
jgi:hypothetical protein